MDEHLPELELLLHRFQYFFGGGHGAADAAEELHRPAAFERQPDVVDQLADAEFGHQECFDFRSELANARAREREQRDGTEQAQLVPALAALIETAFRIRPMMP